MLIIVAKGQQGVFRESRKKADRILDVFTASLIGSRCRAVGRMGLDRSGGGQREMKGRSRSVKDDR